ncbi:MAG: hypothetical protein AAB865_01550 [Patescibacteria group bacterium]
MSRPRRQLISNPRSIAFPFDGRGTRLIFGKNGAPYGQPLRDAISQISAMRGGRSQREHLQIILNGMTRANAVSTYRNLIGGPGFNSWMDEELRHRLEVLGFTTTEALHQDGSLTGTIKWRGREITYVNPPHNPRGVRLGETVIVPIEPKGRRISGNRKALSLSRLHPLEPARPWRS